MASQPAASEMTHLTEESKSLQLLNLLEVLCPRTHTHTHSHTDSHSHTLREYTCRYLYLARLHVRISVLLMSQQSALLRVHTI